MDKKLENFQVSSQGDFDIFWDKLCKENNWSLSFAKKAFYEYKRFLYLAKINDCKVAPSKVIDKVWHLHMTFTKSYWNELCQDILKKEFHHIPSSQGKHSETLDGECYEKTKVLYEQEFECTPPSLYWPILKQRKANTLLLSLISMSCLSLLAACTSTFSSDNEVFSDMVLMLKWIIGIYAVYKILRWLGGGSGKGGCSSGCSSCGGGE